MKSIKLKLLIFIGMIIIACSTILLYRSYTHVIFNIERLTRQQLSLALNFDLAIREYVAETIRPMMYNMVGENRFIPETMSTSFVARSIFKKVRKNFPDFIIKFASNNPRNPVNQAGPEELNMIKYFNDNPENALWAGKILMNDRKYIATFSAMRMEKSCLRCHGDPADAPFELIKRYGSSASFNLPIGKTVGLDTIAIPISAIKPILSEEIFQDLGSLAMVIIFLIVSLTLIFKFTITDRLSKITNHLLEAKKQSKNLKIASVEIEGKDEIATLAESFNLLSKKLNNMYVELTLEIERRKQIQQSLIESEERLRTVLDHAPIILWAIDQNGKLLFSKGRILNKLGLDNKMDIGRSIFDIYADNKQIVSDAHRAIGGESFSSLAEVEGIIFEYRYNPIKDKKGSVIGAIGVAMDVTERKKAEASLIESEKKYRKLFEMESDALALIDVDTGKYLDVNKAFIQMYGYSKKEILSKIKTDISAEPEQTKKNILNQKTFVPIIRHKNKNGTVFPVEIKNNYFTLKGRTVLISAIRDITDRRLIEQQIEQSLKEKELLLSEIHHRVKNNFEIISSLLDMSSMTAENQEVKDILLSSRNRIHSMAMIHTQLYQGNRFDQTDMAKHINELAEHLKFLYKSKQKISIVVDPSEVFLSIKHAIPCALILNELITNSLKHAFADKERGKVQISIHYVKSNNTVFLNLKDNGRGIPDEVYNKSGIGIGLELVKHLVVGQLKGKLQINNNNGTDIRIEFKRLN